MIKFNRKNKTLTIPVGINPNYGIDSSMLYDISDADIVASDVIEGKIGYGKDGKIVGTLDLEGEKEESYQAGYNTGESVGYGNGYSKGYETGENDIINSQSNANITSDDVLEGMIGYSANNTEVIGTLNIDSVKDESYNQGYNAGEAVGITAGRNEIINGQSDGNIVPSDVILNKIGYSSNNTRVVGTLDIDSIKDASYNQGYATGNAEGIETGKAEIIDGMNDATITAGTVLKGEIGYGKNNERIVGEFEFTEGFDFSVIGYNQELSNEENGSISDAIAYSKTLYDAWNPATTNASKYFQDDSLLVYAPLVDTSNVTDMSYFLYACPNLKVIPDYNYVKVTNMQNFCSYSGNTSLNLDLKSCTNASMIASYNTAIIDASINFNNTECNCYGLFYENKKLESAYISNVNSNNSSNMFYQCSKIKNASLNNFITSGKAEYMFQYCSSLTSVPEFDTSGVTTMNNMFHNCTSLVGNITLDLTSCTNASYMFYMPYNLNRLIDVIHINNIGTSLKTLANAFYGAHAKQILFTNCDTSGVTSMGSIFRSNLITEAPEMNTNNVTDMGGMFDDNPNLTTIPRYNVEKANTVYVFATKCPNLTNMGGLLNLGKGFTGTSSGHHTLDLSASHLLTNESCLNIFNTIYDMTQTSVTDAKITLHATTKALLSDDDIAIATSKGWTIA